MANPLENPAWSALNGRHAHLAIGDGPVRRYPAKVSPFAAIEKPSALPVLAERMTPGDNAVLWSPIDLDTPDGLELMIRFPVQQMVAYNFHPADVPDNVPALTADDVPDMLELTSLTKPGPFGTRTREMGYYIGLRENGRLIAMAGERMKPDGFNEISAICTHPDAQGRGLARRLSSIIGRRIVAEGRTPFLNVLPENVRAIGLYESMGFRNSILMRVHLYRKPGGDGAADGFFSSL
ncbi:MAG: GNAT family N-acetyltransferase [Asticcacaulis sp.]|nr:GNAT family N-acetyltransferase [Asticcacaulis sp.]